MHFLFAKTAHADAIGDVLKKVNALFINPLIEFLFALAILYFLYGVYEFLANQANEEKKTTGKDHMIWGIIGITIMMGVWTILGIITNTLNVSDQIDPKEGKVELNEYVIPSK
jgi:uncharacterized membrane protein YidH (DUF202 family)